MQLRSPQVPHRYLGTLPGLRLYFVVADDCVGSSFAEVDCSASVKWGSDDGGNVMPRSDQRFARWRVVLRPLPLAAGLFVPARECSDELDLEPLGRPLGRPALLGVGVFGFARG